MTVKCDWQTWISEQQRVQITTVLFLRSKTQFGGKHILSNTWIKGCPINMTRGKTMLCLRSKEKHWDQRWIFVPIDWSTPSNFKRDVILLFNTERDNHACLTSWKVKVGFCELSSKSLLHMLWLDVIMEQFIWTGSAQQPFLSILRKNEGKHFHEDFLKVSWKQNQSKQI